ncbi:MAG: tetratricopeptide repeat protein, partial [Bacteroidota bacterium]
MRLRRPFFSFRSLVTLLFVLSSVPVSATSQDSLVYQSEAERLFQDAVHLFGTGDNKGAGILFLRVIHEYPSSHRITAAYLMAAKSDYRLGKFRESVKLLKKLLDLYPESSYIDNAHYTLGLNYVQLRRFEDAASEFLQAFQTARDRAVGARAETWLEGLASESLSTG